MNIDLIIIIIKVRGARLQPRHEGVEEAAEAGLSCSSAAVVCCPAGDGAAGGCSDTPGIAPWQTE